MPTTTELLPAGYVLTVTGGASAQGTVQRIPFPGGSDVYETIPVTSGQLYKLGPHLTDRSYAITTDYGTITFSKAIEDPLLSMPTTAQTIPANRVLTVIENSQALIFDHMTVLGKLTVKGSLRVTA